MAGQPMRAPRRKPEMTLAGSLTAGTPSADADIVQSPNSRRVDLPVREPGASDMPAPAPGVVESVDKAMSDFASQLASNLAPQPGITVQSFIRPRPEPEIDLVACGLRVPRYVREAVRLGALTMHVREQEILARALRAYAPLQEALAMTYRQARGDS